jgi:hypothetical protein
MNNKTILFLSSLVIALLFCAPAYADSHNVLKDASFELDVAPDDGGWNPFETSWVSGDQARTGDRSMFNIGLSRTVPYQPFFIGTVSGSFQALPAAPGSRWQLTGYGLVSATLKGAPAFGVVQVSFFDAKGEDLGTVETARTDGPKAKTSNEINRKTPPGEWTWLDTGVATAPEGTATVQAFTLFVDFSGANVGQGVYFDDLTLCAVEDGESGCSDKSAN